MAVDGKFPVDFGGEEEDRTYVEFAFQPVSAPSV